ncbi:MAG: NAD(P)/FAD-dependent oxidoreductase, partial [Dokdonella sp.]
MSRIGCCARADERGGCAVSHRPRAGKACEYSAMNLHKGNRIAVIGGGPAGLMAAETAAGAGMQVDVYE